MKKEKEIERKEREAERKEKEAERKERDAERKERKAEQRERVFLAEEDTEQKILKKKEDAAVAVSTYDILASESVGHTLLSISHSCSYCILFAYNLLKYIIG